MTVGIGFLRTECWAEFEHSVQSCGHQHLFVELRGLGEVCLLSEILYLEECSSSLCTRSNDLWCVDLCETILFHGFHDQPDHQGFELKYGPYLRFSEIHEPVVETCIHLYVHFVYDSHGEWRGCFRIDLHCGRYDLQPEFGLIALFDLSGDRYDGFPRDCRECLEQFRFDLLLRERELDDPISIPECYE